MSRRQIRFAALLIAAFVLGACADAPTAPQQECQVTQGQHDCSYGG